jgi:putative ABC transport system ATP-binding protein
MTPAAASAPVVRLTQVKKNYRVGETEVQALRGVTLDVGAGELLALTGPSGSGKSTLLNICGLIDTPDAGEREINGMVVDGCAEAKLTQLRREKVGFIFQSFNLVPVMTVFDNVEYPLLLLGIPAPERRRRVRETLARVGLGEFERRLPDALSGGQRQRVAIARALVKSPSLVIADEPTGNLDSATAAQIVDLLRELAHEHGAAVIVATHDDRMTNHCDRVLRLTDGELQ